MLVPVEDEEALKLAMEKLFYDRELYKRLRANTRKSIEKFNVNNIIKGWLNLFEEGDC